MTDKNQITIYGKTYNIKTDLSGVNPQDLANYVNEKMHALSSGKTKPSTIDLAILTALNIAGELFEIKETAKQEMTQKKSGLREEEQKAHMTEALAREEALLVGISSGANVLAAQRVAKTLSPDDVVVTVLCDTGTRYFSIEEYFHKDEVQDQSALL